MPTDPLQGFGLFMQGLNTLPRAGRVIEDEQRAVARDQLQQQAIDSLLSQIANVNDPAQLQSAPQSALATLFAPTEQDALKLLSGRVAKDQTLTGNVDQMRAQQQERLKNAADLFPNAFENAAFGEAGRAAVQANEAQLAAAILAADKSRAAAKGGTPRSITKQELLVDFATTALSTELQRVRPLLDEWRQAHPNATQAQQHDFATERIFAGLSGDKNTPFYEAPGLARHVANAAGGALVTGANDERFENVDLSAIIARRLANSLAGGAALIESGTIAPVNMETLLRLADESPDVVPAFDQNAGQQAQQLDPNARVSDAIIEETRQERRAINSIPDPNERLRKMQEYYRKREGGGR